MTFRIGLALGALALVCSCRTEVPAPPPAPPRITSFTATPSEIEVGDTARLAFTVEGAETLELRDQLGALVTLDGTGADVKPEISTVYVLEATGPGGRDTAFARVKVGDAVESIFLVAVPATVPAGEAVSLVYDATGATEVRLSAADGTDVPLTGTSGVVTVTPLRSTQYTLSANPGGGQPRISRAVDVTVEPVITRFTATPPAARPGSTISLGWDTAGAETVSLQESTFGELLPSTTQVQNGQFTFTVPAALPGDAGIMTPIGFPLSFTLTARTGAPGQLASRVLRGSVGDGPIITAFVTPRFVVAGKLVPFSWATTAERIELEADGQVIYSASGTRARQHTLTVLAPAATLEYRLRAFDSNGLETSALREVNVVPLPEALTFTAPATVVDALSEAQLAWTASGAATIVVRAKDGPVLFSTESASQLASGSARLRLGRSTTLVLEVRNAAGDVASLERRVTVTSPATVSVPADPAFAGNDVTFSWDFSAQSASEVAGVPTAPVATMNATTFVDLSADPEATELYVTDANEQLVSFTTPQGFVFPALDEPASTFWVSTNGFLSFVSTTVPRPANLDLETTTTVLPAQVAPFWDNLQIGAGGSIRWRVDGSFPRRLIVQWTNMLVNGDPASRLTFQVQLFENGRFRFVYQTLRDGTAPEASGQSASIGVYLGVGRFRENVGFNTASVAEGLELAWFGSMSVTGSTTSRVSRPSTFAPFFRAPSGAWVAAPVQPRVFVADTVFMSELMPVPSAQAPAGRYVELTNPGTQPVDVGGLELIIPDAGMAGWIIPPAIVIPPAGRLVIGESLVAAENGGAPVDLTAPAGRIPGVAQGSFELRVPGVATPITQLTWGHEADGGTTPSEAVALQTDPVALRSKPNGRFVCNRGTRTFGGSGTVGTPSAENEGCYFYRSEVIPLAWEDVSATGTRLFTGVEATSFDDKVTNVTLAQPFPYFGASYGEVTVGTNGFIATRLTTSTASTNKVAPSSTNPTGTIAPFWDDLDRKTNAADGNVYVERKNGYTVVQWHRVGTWTSVETIDDYNFEAKLFDTGVIEFHYQLMRNNSLLDNSAGGSATVWIEEPGGASALPISINRPAPRQNTAVRFTPN